MERLLSAGALHRESQEAPVPPALQTLPKRFQLQARLGPFLRCTCFLYPFPLCIHLHALMCILA